MADDGLKDFLEEHLAPLGPVRLKRMFGGYGIFLDGLMFGLVMDGGVYFKTDAQTRSAFEDEGQGPFTYEKQGGVATLVNYWHVPDRLFDEPDELVEWARRAALVARQTARVPRTSTGSKSKSTAKTRKARHAKLE